MVLRMVQPENMVNPPSKELLAAVDVFLNTHYVFRCEDKYKGFWGRIRASSDRLAAEQREREREEYAQLRAFEISTPELYTEPIYHSDPPSREWVEKHEEETRKREEEFRRWTIEQSFSVTLMKLIEAKGKDSVEIYKRAHIDRKLFSKIRSQTDYVPSKKTVIALALALELSLDETQALLERAGFTLSRSILSDVIVEYFISHGKYDIHELNGVLFVHKQSLLSV